MNKITYFFESKFKLKEHKTDIKTEIIAGLTTFATMAFILAAVPNIMSQAGFDKGSTLTAVVLLVFASTFVMALVTNKPFALGPGLGSVGVFAATMIAGDNISIPIASGVIFWSGILFVFISFIGLREAIVQAIPPSIKISVSAGLGLFLALLGFKNVGIIVANPVSNTLEFGNLSSPAAILAILGFVLILILEVRKVKGGMLIAVIATTIIGIPMGVTIIPDTLFSLPSGFSEYAFNIDIIGSFSIEYLPFLFAFFVPDFFSTFGTIIGVGAKAGYLDENGDMEGIDNCFKVDGIATTVGAFFCIPCMTTYLESVAGVEAGGKTGLTSMTTAFVFLGTLLITPIALMIPAAAVEPVLMYIGIKMLSSMKHIDYEDMLEYLPAFIAITLTIFTNNIANGIAGAVISYVILKLSLGKEVYSKVPKLMYGLAVILGYYFYTLA
ncbi:NCS2 family permease [uncultured Clostridium sp.]|uniref:NCS2 family permease n=1 Tax=uncultured Clostridium sp. TaxID=59620 RepID=UPI0026205507|nr:NCS2 family permease [uncultured Clostridium sp.]